VVSGQIGKLYGTTTFPVTYKVLDLVGGSFNLFILIILTFYAGEAIWRERAVKIDQVFDAYPTPNWIKISSKFLGLQVVVLCLLFLILVAGVLVQAVKGYSHFEIGLYLEHLFFVKYIGFFNLCALAFFLQIILNNKYMAYGGMILYYILSAWLPSLGFEHVLYRFNSSVLPSYSDMNGYGRFLHAFYSLRFYWLSFAGVLLLFGLLFWQRGTLTDQASRWVEFRRRWGLRYGIGMGLLSALFLGFGAYIFYNTNMKNQYRTSQQVEQLKYDYEKKYKDYEGKEMPHVVGVKAFVDIFPYQAKSKIRVLYRLKNTSSEDQKEIFINSRSFYKAKFLFSEKTGEKLRDQNQDIVIFEFDKPLKPGEEVELDYQVLIDASFFPNGNPETDIVQNGTFFSSFSDFFPTFGYEPSLELSATKTRKKYGLKAKKRMPDLFDEKAREHTYISSNAHWIDFEATVSTAKDQMAIAPGYLTKEWEENGRRYFHYKMDQKILNFFSFLSGRYTVKRDRWKDVNIEVYYHKGHDYNIDRMIESTKMSLDYFSKNFSPYQHKQFRIIEFPRYASFAQAFPNTIPFSEAIGFIVKVDDDDPKDVDFPFYVTAHELAHQWWAHQVIGGNVQGATMMSETFSQYSALMVMEKKYGKKRMKRFLKYELDKYLRGRGGEHEKELPLYRSENQGYIHYNKGSLVMYTLKDLIGEQKLNAILSEYIKQVGYQKPPYTTSLDFMSLLRSQTEKKYHPIIAEIFEKIVLFQNRPLNASYKKLANGKYQVNVTVSCKKLVS
ncbi:MAG: M1 family aminopeptidase, partial [Pseudomonadota bacterium]